MRQWLSKALGPLLRRSGGPGAGSGACARPAGAAAASFSASPAPPGPPPPGSHAVRAALVRALPTSFAASLKMHEPGEPIDVARAHAQHADYMSLLRRLVPRVVEVPADESCPDCVFIEDTAIVTPCGVAVVSRPGAPQRRSEVGAVEAALQQLAAEGGGGSGGGDGAPLIRAVHRIEAPGLLDGGDVLQIAGYVLVGLSARTNQAAVDQLRRLLLQPGGGGDSGGGGGLRVEAIEVAHGLHLKSACSALDDATLLLSDDAAGASVAAAIRGKLPALAEKLAFEVMHGDALAANVLRVGPHVVMQAGSEAAEARLRALCGARGLTLHVLPRATEFIKADGALTCCSILLS